MYWARLLVQPFSEVPRRLRLRSLTGTLRFPPESLDTLLVHLPALPSEKCPHPAVAVAGVLAAEGYHPLHQSRVFAGLGRDVALAGTRLLQNPASPTLGDLKPLLQMLHSSPSPGRAQKFPRFTSLRRSMSSSFSARSFLRRAFSFSSSLRRLASCELIPPYSGFSSGGK